MEKSRLLDLLENRCKRVKSASGHYTQEAKRVVCELVEKGEYNWTEVGLELNCHYTTANRWPFQLERKKAHGSRAQFSVTDKIRIVAEFTKSGEPIGEFAKRYTLDAGMIRRWEREYSLQFYSQPRVTKSMAGKESNDGSEESAILQSRIKDLEKALSEERLKVEGLQTMIKVAEQELNIGIRKKFGTKQSGS